MRTMNSICRQLLALMALCFLLSACNTFTRLSEVNNGPQISEIANPTARPKYRPVSMPMPAPKTINRKANSLWRPGARAFFRDQRAGRVGDILTIKLAISDKAALANKTTRARDDAEDAARHVDGGADAKWRRCEGRAHEREPEGCPEGGHSRTSQGRRGAFDGVARGASQQSQR